MGQKFKINQLSSAPDDWFEQIQLLPVSIIRKDENFDKYALNGPISQFTLLLDAVANYLELPGQNQSPFKL